MPAALYLPNPPKQGGLFSGSCSGSHCFGVFVSMESACMNSNPAACRAFFMVSFTSRWRCSERICNQHREYEMIL